MTEKCKLNDLAKDLGVSNKELIDLLEKKYGEQKKATAVLVDKELNFVIEGSMEFYLGATTTVLNAGDSVYFNSGIPHAMRALNGERVQFLAVVMGEPNR